MRYKSIWLWTRLQIYYVDNLTIFHLMPPQAANHLKTKHQNGRQIGQEIKFALRVGCNIIISSSSGVWNVGFNFIYTREMIGFLKINDTCFSYNRYEWKRLSVVPNYVISLLVFAFYPSLYIPSFSYFIILLDGCLSKVLLLWLVN